MTLWKSADNTNMVVFENLTIKINCSNKDSEDFFYYVNNMKHFLNEEE